MARISDTKGRVDRNSGYARLFGNVELGRLISRVHATVIRMGNELEGLLEEWTSPAIKATLAAALVEAQRGTSSRLQVVFSPQVEGIKAGHGIVSDIVVFDHSRRVVAVIEVKDGDTFDTKKANGELASMNHLAQWISERTGYDPRIYFCSFNQEDKSAIVAGAKGRFPEENAMTGRELCGILGIDYDALVRERREHAAENLVYFIDELLAIPEVRGLVKSRIALEEQEDG